MTTPGLNAPPGPFDIDKSGTIRKFYDPKIQLAVLRAVRDIPEGKKGVIVAVADGDGARLTALARLGGHWSVAMVGNRDWSGKLEGQAAVVFSF